MRHLRFALTLAALLTLPGWVPAQAAQPAPEIPSTASTPEQVPVGELRCESKTGSRIVTKPDAKGGCPDHSAAVQSFSQEDLRSTGRSDLSEALQQLSSSVTRSY